MTQQATCAPPACPQPSQLAITFQQCQRRYASRPVGHFPWKDFHLKMSGHGYVVGTDWAMTTFCTRPEDQFLDRKCLQMIDENTEVLFFHPFDSLGYLDVMEDTRDQPDQAVQEGVLKRIYAGMKSALSQFELKSQTLCSYLFGRS